MDKKTAKELGGTLAQITASYDRKISDNAYGSVGVFFSATLDVAPGADPDEAMDALFAWVKAAAVRNAREPFEDVTHNTAEAELPKTQTKGDPPEGEVEGETNTMNVTKYVVTQRPDGYELALYPNIKGSPGKWPDIKFYGDRDKLWTMIEPVWDDVGKIPSENVVNWTATFVYGRKKQNSDNRFKDLVQLAPGNVS